MQREANPASSRNGPAANALHRRDSPSSVHGSAGRAWVKLNLAKRSLVVGDVLLQKRHQRFRLLWAEVDSLKIAQLYLRLRTLLHGSEDEEKIPDIDTYLDAIGISLTVVGGVRKFDIRLWRRI